MKVIFVIIGTLIGAGFASGQEMYSFFYIYGINGILGIILSSTLMGIIIYKTFRLSNKENINNYKDFLQAILPLKNKNQFLDIINLIINIFILITFFIMIAGFGAYFEQELKINSIIGSMIISILCYILLQKNTNGLIKSNEMIVPILVIFLLGIGIFNLKDINIFFIEQYLMENNSNNWIFSSLLYTGYNSILLIPILITIRKYAKDKRKIIAISIITNVIISVISIFIFLLLTKIDVDISQVEMPAIYVVSKILKGAKNMYGIIILLSIFTTALSLGISFLQNMCKSKKSYTQVLVIMCIMSVLISKIGFSNLINSIYPIFGYIGLLQIFILCSRIKLTLNIAKEERSYERFLGRTKNQKSK